MRCESLPEETVAKARDRPRALCRDRGKYSGGNGIVEGSVRQPQGHPAGDRNEARPFAARGSDDARNEGNEQSHEADLDGHIELFENVGATEREWQTHNRGQQDAAATAL